MTSKERFYAILSNRPADRPALINPTSVATTDTVNALGLGFANVHTSAEDMAAVACYAYENLGFDSIAPYFSVLAEAAAMGADIDWGENNSMPKQRGAVFNEIKPFPVPADILEKPSTAAILGALILIKKKHGDEALIIGKAMGPWTLAMHIFGVMETLIATIDDKEKLHSALASACEITKLFILAQLQAGADMVTVADHATRNLISPHSYCEFVQPFHKELNKLYPGKLILHCCGNIEDRAAYFAEGGFPLCHFESANDPARMVQLSGDMALTGSLNNPVTLLSGDPQAIREEVRYNLKAGVRLISPECAIPLSVKNESLRIIADCIGAYPSHN